jgi:hypothetical protein
MCSVLELSVFWQVSFMTLTFIVPMFLTLFLKSQSRHQHSEVGHTDQQTPTLRYIRTFSLPQSDTEVISSQHTNNQHQTRFVCRTTPRVRLLTRSTIIWLKSDFDACALVHQSTVNDIRINYIIVVTRGVICE